MANIADDFCITNKSKRYETRTQPEFPVEVTFTFVHKILGPPTSTLHTEIVGELRVREKVKME